MIVFCLERLSASAHHFTIVAYMDNSSFPGKFLNIFVSFAPVIGSGAWLHQSTDVLY